LRPDSSHTQSAGLAEMGLVGGSWTRSAAYLDSFTSASHATAATFSSASTDVWFTSAAAQSVTSVGSSSHGSGTRAISGPPSRTRACSLTTSYLSSSTLNPSSPPIAIFVGPLSSAVAGGASLATLVCFSCT